MTIVRLASETPLESIGAGRRAARQVLLGPETGSTFHTRRFVMEPGGGMPNHTNSVEHQQYVLRGAARVGIGDEVHDIHAGMVVHIPAGVPHWYRVDGTEPFEFLCMVPAGDDEVELLGTDIPTD
ncbi:MAG: cupin domain-containing protein [Gemmatimonadales bacterium]|nr:MAG: cupin domain-containing protein [Gemmatimonadales bacterium]